jgi:hypothetical protein
MMIQTMCAFTHLHNPPKLVTNPKLQSVLEELIKREPIFHRPESGATRCKASRRLARN